MEDKRTNILVISGNYDLMYPIKGYRQMDVFMMLAVPESSSPSFYHCANVTWLWASQDPQRASATMINGGGPIPPVPPVRVCVTNMVVDIT
ncbi:unnamed protein product [Eruca vesicaria subsp. sativa]|uniref:Uncharacterized protein n=1 Tax=Eruca vesicaria subsp. sativa TaxID=29727 RepID=A0ABC8M4A2_ERUVS|nr:unnamed protein product [Eruca vesicaria subsp. sativa]